jgi:mono/diheme cytochrome c family protein
MAEAPRRRLVLACLAALALTACRPLRATLHEGPDAGTAAARDAVARGSTLYAAYCGGCHGADGRGDGPVARALALVATDLRTPGLVAGASDAALIDRIRSGTPLAGRARWSAVLEERQVAALMDYVAQLSSHDWARVRAGRVVYDMACSACHGAYGTGEGVLGGFLALPPASLPRAVARYSDPALAGVVRMGVAGMPAMGDVLAPAEVRAVVAYLRLLSPGQRTYDLYCAGCHGDDGRGVHAEDLLAPAVAAPPIDPASLAPLDETRRRERILHMLRREQGMMPHFRDVVTDAELADIVAYLRRHVAPAS